MTSNRQLADNLRRGTEKGLYTPRHFAVKGRLAIRIAVLGHKGSGVLRAIAFLLARECHWIPMPDHPQIW